MHFCCAELQRIPSLFKNRYYFYIDMRETRVYLVKLIRRLSKIHKRATKTVRLNSEAKQEFGSQSLAACTEFILDSVRCLTEPAF